MFLIDPVPVLKDNYVWLISDPKRHVAIVDPGDAAPVLAKIRAAQLIPTAILITHHHWDHVNGIDDILAVFPVPVYAGAKEAVSQTTNPLADGQQIELPGLKANFVIHAVPGHTLGAIAFHGEGCLFSGDTLFTAGCGRLFEGSPKQMYHSLEALRVLPATTQLYCGHEYTEANLVFAAQVEPDNPAIAARRQAVCAQRAQGQASVPASLAIECDTNPFLRTHEPTVISAAAAYAGKSLSDPVDVFASLRKWKDTC